MPINYCENMCKTCEKILKYIKEKGKVSPSEIKEKFEFPKSHIKRLVHSGKIIYQARGRDKGYVLPKKRNNPKKKKR